MTAHQERNRHVLRPRPRDVPAYQEARDAGLLPSVPATPPQVTVRPAAHQALRDVVVVVALTVAGVAAVLLLGSSDGRLSWAVVALLLAVATAGVLLLAAAVRRWGRAQLAELRCGYTTTTFRMGRFWVGTAPDGPVTNGWVQWDWGAVWVLRPDGTVVSAPSHDGDPPGLYPSPGHRGAFELWTGHQWTGHLRQPRHD